MILRRQYILFGFLMVLSLTSQAQFVKVPEGQRQNPKDDQSLIDEQLANQYYRDQEYEKAKDIYKKLYEKKKQINFFQQYIDCTILLKQYDEAEKELKTFSKSNPNYQRSLIDLIYVYTVEKKADKADKQFSEILKSLPDKAPVIRSTSNLFQARGLYEMALAVLEKGNTLLGGKETFYMEQANIYHSMANYQDAFHHYFLELEKNPGQYNTIKNRLHTLLFYDVNKSITDELRIALLKRTQEKPDNLELAQMLVWFAIQEEDYDIALAQCQSIDRRTQDQDAQILNLSGICLNNKQFDVAQKGYSYIYDKGESNPFYGQALAGLINAEYQQLKAENRTDIKAFEKLSKRIDEAYSRVNSNDLSKLTLIQADILGYQLGKSDEAIALLINTLPNIGNKQDQAALKLKLADIYLHEDEVWEATLLYSQVDKSMKEEPLGHEARFRNAQLRYFIGEYEWAESQLKVLKAATSKLIANDAMTLSLIIKDNLEVDSTGTELNRLARVDYRIYQQRDNEAVTLLDDIIATGNEISIPHALFRKGEIAEKRKEFEDAERLFLQIVEQYPDSYMADAALMRAALIEHNELKDKEAAKQHYEQLIDDYPTSIYTAQAKKNFRKL